MATSETVARNVAAIRVQRGLSLRALSDRMSELGHPMLVSGISKIENGERKVSVEDLVVLALALVVSPVRLLLPLVDDGPVRLTREYSALWSDAWRWATGDAPLDEQDASELLRWVRTNRPHDDAGIYAAWVTVVEQTEGFTVERDECGRVTAISSEHGTGVRALPGGGVEEYTGTRIPHDPEWTPKLPPLPPTPGGRDGR